MIARHFFRSSAKLSLLVASSRSAPRADSITIPAEGEALQPFCGAEISTSTPVSRISTQTAPEVSLVNSDLADEITPIARRSTPEQTVRALDAILRARTALEGNVAPLLALEALLISLSLAGRT